MFLKELRSTYTELRLEGVREIQSSKSACFFWGGHVCLFAPLAPLFQRSDQIAALEFGVFCTAAGLVD